MSDVHITVTIDMETFGAPFETAVSDTLTLTLPRLSSKYIQFPKILEGMLERLAEHHNNRVTQWEVQRERAARERRERPQLWDDLPTDTEAPEDNELTAIPEPPPAAPDAEIIPIFADDEQTIIGWQFVSSTDAEISSGPTAALSGEES